MFNNVGLVSIITLLTVCGLYFHVHSTESVEIRQWRSEKSPVKMNARDFSGVVTKKITDHKDLPYNRTQYFSAGIENIDTENDYAILYDAHPKDNEMMFREYGYLVTTRGIIIKTQMENHKADEDKYGVNILQIPFQDVYKVKLKSDSQLIVFYADHTKRKVNLNSESLKILLDVLNLAIDVGWTKVSKDNVLFLGEEINADLESATEQAINNSKQLSSRNGGILSSLNKAAFNDLGENQLNDRFGGGQGHGHVGEQYGDTLDRIKFKNTKREGATHAKNGADRIVNGKVIQTKYLKSAGKTVGQTFNGGQAKYTFGEGTNKRMMIIEVPRDQYEDSVKIIAKRIKDGEVPNESNPQNAVKYLKKGAISYEHSQIATKSIFDRHSEIPMHDENNKVIRDSDGNIQMKSVTLGDKLVWSVGGDFMTGVASSMPTALVNGVWIYCNSRWHGSSEKEALKSTALAIAKPVVWGGSMYMIASQFAGSKMGKALGNQLFSGGNLSNSVKTAKVTGLALGTVTAVVAFGPDVVSCLRGRISTQQLIKNSVVTGTGMATGAAVGGVIGSGIPVVGTAIGAVVGGTIGSLGAKKIMDQFVEDDAILMIRIAKEEFIETVLSVPLKADEVEIILQSTFLNKRFNHQLQIMFASESPRKYIHKIYFDKILDIFKQRKLPDENELIALV